MRTKILPLFIILYFFVKPAESVAQVNTQDSLALVDFYNSTNGPNWGFVHWDFKDPVSRWQGIGTQQNRVTSMKLWGACRGGKILPSFGNLTALKSIEFLDCKLTDASLPVEFSKLTNLTYLYMHAVFYYLPFPAVITKMPNLTVIDFEDNLFTDTIPAAIGKLINLTYLDLSNSYFPNGSKIPAELGNLKKLETLILSSAHLIDTIPSSFGNLESLTSLAIADNQLMGNIPTSLNQLKKLDYLSFGYNQFTFEGIEPFLINANQLSKTYTELDYSPQQSIPISRLHYKIAVSAGGTLSRNTYKWYKDGGNNLVATVTGDSTFKPDYVGKYFAEVVNSIVPGLTLHSDTIDFKYILAESNTTVLKNVSGTEITQINDSFFKVVSVKPIAGADALSGNVIARVNIDPAVSAYNGQPYVQRHYDIRPWENTASARAIVYLYFSQQEFDNYNTYVTNTGLSYPPLPTAGTNNGNIRVSQFHGSFTTSPDPGNYGSDRVLITPEVTWDPTNKWWELRFPVNGFSGFFVSTGNDVLPLSLIKFNGSLHQGSVALQWITENDKGIKEYNVEKSIDGKNFINIGKVLSLSTPGKNSYHFEDAMPQNGTNYYRLRMVDRDSRSAYSSIYMINLVGRNANVTIYPNPATALLNLKFNLIKDEVIHLQIFDALGTLVERKIIQGNAGTNNTSISIEQLSNGIYFLQTEIDGVKERAKFVKK